MRKPTFSFFNPSRWMWQIGSLLGVLGGAAGVVAALFFVWAQAISISPGLQFLMSTTSQENSFRFILVLIAGFVLAGILSFFSRAAEWFGRVVGVAILALGIALTGLSILSGFSVGGFTLFGALLVLLGGVWLVLASRLQPF